MNTTSRSPALPTGRPRGDPGRGRRGPSGDGHRPGPGAGGGGLRAGLSRAADAVSARMRARASTLLPALVLVLTVALPVAAGGAAWTAPPLAAQSDTDLARAEATYEGALEAYLQVLSARDQALQQHDILMDRQEDARRSGDEDRAQEAMRRVHEQGVQVMLLDQQLRTVASQLQEAGRAYLAALDVREDELLDRIEVAALPETRAALDRELSEIRARYREVERESGSPTLGELRPLPDVVIDRRDGPDELRGKAGILESRAAEYDSVIVALEQEIVQRERRLQQERGREDLIAGISRFDDDILTGGGITPPTGGSGSGGVDPATPVNLAELALPEQVALLREYLTMAEGLRDEALARARVFRARAEGGSP